MTHALIRIKLPAESSRRICYRHVVDVATARQAFLVVIPRDHYMCVVRGLSSGFDRAGDPQGDSYFT